MPRTDTRSLQQIKRETEQTRAGLTSTVEQLRTSLTDTASDIRHRVSPDAIKSEVSDYIRNKKERLIDDVTAAALRNPMQTVAVGAGIAYPLLRLARSIPLPVLMVGAGLFLSSSKTGQSITKKAGEMASDLSDEVGRRAHDLGQQVRTSALSAQTLASDRVDQIGDVVSSSADQVSRATETVRATIASGSDKLRDTVTSFGAAAADRTSDLGTKGVRAASSAASTIPGIVADASSAAQRVIGQNVDAGREAVKSVQQGASDLAGRAQKTFFETIQDNPLVVAGVGLMIGGLIASALPRSEIEDGWIGDASASVKRRAQAAAAQGFAAAKNTAGEIYDEVAQKAQDEGLTAGAFDKAAQDLGQRVRHVAESAVTTAFDPEHDNHQSSSDNQGDNHHG